MRRPDRVEIMMDERSHLPDIGVVVEHNHLVGCEAYVEFDTIGPMGQSELERLDRVVACVS